MKRLLFALIVVLPVLAQTPKPSANSAKNSLGMEFVKIAPGEFTMGCSTDDSACEADEKPAHSVQITKSFEIGKYEVTQAQWVAVMGSNPSTNKGDNRPVETVSKQDAMDFLAKLNALNDGYKYRLPTEAEWEYAARAGQPPPKSLDEVAWYADNSGDETHPVGQKKPNAWGLYDMLGNVREWVSDQYAMNYYANSPAADPTGPAPGQGGRGGFGGRGNFNRRRFNNGDPNNGQPNGNNNSGQPAPTPIAYQQSGPQDPQGGGNEGGGPQNGQQGQPGQQGGPGGFPRRGFGGRGNFNGRGPDRQLPIMRGGAWDNPANFVRLSARYHYYGPTLKLSDIGFRAAREPIQPEGGK